MRTLSRHLPSYEAFGAWISQNEPFFPLRAGDSIDRDLRMHPEDMWELAYEVAHRAGYDVANWEASPLVEEIRTVQDFVLFINHQPRMVQTGHQGHWRNCWNPS